MYKSNSNTPTMPQQRQRKGRRRAARQKRILIGVAALVCLLTCAAQALVRSPTLAPAAASTAQPKSEVALVAIKSLAAPAPPIVAAAEPPALAAPAAEDDWRLLLVNPWTPIPDDYEVSLTKLKNGHSVDERCYPGLQAMMDDCRAAGLKPIICSSYRTQETQQRLFNNIVKKYLAKGYSEEDARVEAGKSVAVPGTSEHQLGLAVDIVDISNQILDSSQEKTAVQKWLMENSWRYGFILRYPNDKSDLTGIIYEPWHYRYVGKVAAKEIYEQRICLEEYLSQ